MFIDRTHAGKLLAEKLENGRNSIVLAIPRGGVVVGDQIAKKLKCTLDVIISKKITPPNHPEFAIGAITFDGTTYQSNNWSSFCDHPNFDQELKNKKIEVQRRLKEYRGNTNYNLDNKTVILVDDGIATGSTVISILNWLSKIKPKKIILAVPVMPQDTFEIMRKLVSEIICLKIPYYFSSVGEFYDKFNQVTDDEVLKVLSQY